MEWGQLRIAELADTGDARGRSFASVGGPLTAGFAVRDAHLATIRPGCVRGNHFHQGKDEILLVLHADAFSVHWDTGEGTPAQHHQVTGAGAVVITVGPGASHAIRNDGAADLYLVGLSDQPYDPAAPDVIAREVVA
jgi:dTDP-4-dehydrorhamnose 3,5-epimerase-like enzyme